MSNITDICNCTLPDDNVETICIKLSPLKKVFQRIDQVEQLVIAPTAADYGDMHMQQSIVYYARETLLDNVVDCAQILLSERTLQREGHQIMRSKQEKFLIAIMAIVFVITFGTIAWMFLSGNI